MRILLSDIHGISSHIWQKKSYCHYQIIITTRYENDNWKMISSPAGGGGGRGVAPRKNGMRLCGPLFKAPSPFLSDEQNLRFLTFFMT